MKLFRTLSLVAGLIFVLSANKAFAATNKTLGTYDTAGNARDVTVVDNYAYVADSSDGVIVLNIANPSAPTLAGQYDTPGTATQLEVSGTTLLVSDSTSLQILNITNPTTPTFYSSYSQAGLTLHDVTIDGNYAYIVGVLNSANTLEVLDISNPAVPVLKNTLGVHGAWGVIVSGAYVYTVGDQYLDIINTYPVFTQVGEFADSAGMSFDSVQVSGSYAYINGFIGGLRVVNIGTPSAPTLSYGETTGHDKGGGVSTSNGYIFLNQAVGGLVIYDFIASPSTPVYVDTYASSAPGYAVAIADTTAVVASYSAGVELLDVSKPDTVPPVITLAGPGGSGSAPQVISVGGKFTDPGATSVDNIDGNLTVTVTGTVDTSTVGKYVLTYTVTDRAGNTTTTTRTVIIAPSVTTITGKNNVYSQKVNGKTVTIRSPLPGYTGAVVARKLIVHKLTDPMFLFIATGPYRKSAIVLYNYKGAVISRVDLTKLSTKGLHLDLMIDPNSLTVMLALNPNIAATTVRMFTIGASGLKSAGNLTVATKPALIFEKMLKYYPSEVGVGTMVRGKTSTIRIWRYNTKTKVFARDTKYDLSLLKLSGTSIVLK